MNFFQAIKYLEYQLTAGHRKGHGIHSPFIFDIVCRLFRNKNRPSIVCTVETIRKSLLSDMRTITVNDLGAGGVKRKQDRRVSEIARYSAVPEKYGVLLANMSEEFGGNVIIELGTSLAISAMYMASGCPGAIVHTIEGCSECAAIARENLNTAGIRNVNVMDGSFDDILPKVIAKGVNPGLVFIDGNHRKEPVLKYFSEIINVSGENTVIILDDIYYSREMQEAWTEIKNHDEVSATIDIFRMGIVFMKKQITCNHYKIRY